MAKEASEAQLSPSTYLAFTAPTVGPHIGCGFFGIGIGIGKHGDKGDVEDNAWLGEFRDPLRYLRMPVLPGMSAAGEGKEGT